jgi:glycosyltransferase involved in cell wall biosynthesis
MPESRFRYRAQPRLDVRILLGDFLGHAHLPRDCGKNAMTPANVLFVIGSLEVGGTELHVAKLAAALQQRGWRVAVYSVYGDGPMRRQIESTGTRVILPPLSFLHAARWILYCLAAIHLFWTLIRRRWDIVHFFLPRAYLIGAPLAALAGVPVRVMSRRSLNNYQRGGFVGALERRLHRTVHAIIGNSRSVIGQLKDEGVPPDRLALIYNGLDAAAFATAAGEGRRGRLSLPPDALIMCIIANLIAYKGHRDLIDALASAAPKLPPGWRLLVVGRDDGIGPQLQSQARRLGLQDHIDLLGARNDVAAILAASDIGILCSHEEGFANAILEGMAAGLPMIVTDVGGNAEAVIDGETGLVVPAKDPGRLADAILRLARDAELRSRYGAAGRRRVHERFAMQQCVAAYEMLYRTLLGGGVPADIAEIRVS